MFRLVLAFFHLASMPQAANAQLLGKIIGLKTEGVISADYKKNERVRVASADKIDVPFEIAFEKVVEMVAAKDFDRFALIRNKCETTFDRLTRRIILRTCILWAKMLSDGDVARPKGKNDEVVYFRISENGVASTEDWRISD